MKILHVYRTYFPETQGGLEETIRQICGNAKALGVESKVLALSSDGPKVVEYDDTKVHFAHLDLEIASCGMSLGAFKLHDELVNWADVIHYHFPWPFSDALYLATKRKLKTKMKPAIVTYHSDIVRQRVLGQLYKPLMNHFLKSVEHIVATSPNYFATSDVLNHYQEKVTVIPIGLDPNSYPDTNPTILEETEQRYGRNFFLFVGVLRYYKGLHILLDAAKNSDVQIVIVGSGPIEGELKAQAAELQLTNVTFAGHVTNQEKVALFKLSRAVVFPSYLRSEAFGVTLLEGAMYGKPLISTEVGSGTSHVNVDRLSGFVVPPGNATALREAMSRLHHQPDMALLMGKKARERFNKLFTGKLMAQRYLELYERLAGLSEPTEAKEAKEAIDTKAIKTW